MKKLLAIGVIALTIIVLSTPTASAWINFKAGIGANLSFQGGGNNFAWGLWRGGQPPGQDQFGYGQHPYGPQFGGHPFFGQAETAEPPAVTTPNNPAAPANPPAAESQTRYFSYPNAQPVSYPSYYYMPGYWYGR